MSKIEWTEDTWNPVVGCTVTSPGCKNCYAMGMAARLEAMSRTTGAAEHYAGTTKVVNGNTVWTGKIGEAPASVWEKPLRRRKPTTYFVNSMGDLFHPNVSHAQIDRVFAVMALAPQHRFQVLTKHPERMRDWMRDKQRSEWGDLGFVDFFVQAFDWPYYEDEKRARELDSLINDGTRDDALCCKTFLWDNVWLGVSVEDQQRANERVPVLLETPAAVRFVSAEPLLGPVDLSWIVFDDISVVDALTGMHGFPVPHAQGSARLDWVIVGGESGQDARPMHAGWARFLRDQCAMTGTPFFFKQWGEWLSWSQFGAAGIEDQEQGSRFPTSAWDGRRWVEQDIAGWWDVDHAAEYIGRVGKTAAGRQLDNVVHNAMPEFRP